MADILLWSPSNPLSSFMVYRSHKSKIQYDNHLHNHSYRIHLWEYSVAQPRSFSYVSIQSLSCIDRNIAPVRSGAIRSCDRFLGRWKIFETWVFIFFLYWQKYEHSMFICAEDTNLIHSGWAREDNLYALEGRTSSRDYVETNCKSTALVKMKMVSMRKQKID